MALVMVTATAPGGTPCSCSLETSLSDGIAKGAGFTIESTTVPCTAMPAYEGTGTAALGTGAIGLMEKGGAGANVYGRGLDGRKEGGVEGKEK